ncbi:BCS1 N terminal-domain-containing protein [Biscogniauxia mediterranea]|nr:BCS1 N terminal-domain-containing protein [Biscogniauxia mediterranea]
MDNTTHEALLGAANTSSSLNSTTTLGLGANIIELLLTLFGLKSLSPLFQHVNNGTEWSTTTTLAFLCLGWVSCKALSQGYQEVRRVFDRHFMSTVILIEKDFLYSSTLSWLAKHPNIIDSRNVLAENQMAETDDEETAKVLRQSGGYLNFSKQGCQIPPKYLPAEGSHDIWWRGRYFRVIRSTVADSKRYSGHSTSLSISCFGRSTNPVKELILQAREDYTSDSDSQTTVYKPDPIEMRNGRRSQFNWMKCVTRPVRGMQTVVLDEQQKKRVLDDMNDYLHPATARWYADRGIPLRRGYIFFGPPGTGKTSLAYALAGQFGLDIFVASLEDGTMTDRTLGLLVNSLPRRCVLLLEDIDAVGIARPDGSSSRQKKTATKKAGGDDDDDDDDDDMDNKGPLSLSGLLNAIDGVAGQEGRTLIVTTNRIHSLDKALLRPGRIDLQIGFSNATQKQARELFSWMYDDDNYYHRHPSNYDKDGGGGGGKPNDKNTTAAAATTTTTTTSSDAGTDGLETTAPHEDDDTLLFLPHPSSYSSSPPSPSPSPSPSSPPSSTCPVPSTSTSPAAAAKSKSKSGGRINISSSSSSQGALEDDVAAVSVSVSLSEQFAGKIPGGALTPAEIQGFLLRHKGRPRRAVREADAWVAEVVGGVRRQQKAEAGEGEGEGEGVVGAGAGDENPPLLLLERDDSKSARAREQIRKVSRFL